MMKLSVAIIVRNEETEILDCLESVKEADEIVVVDTGSEDATIARLEAWALKRVERKEGDVLIDFFEWCDDFSAARNYANSKCTGDWILVIDADERLMPKGISKLREAITHAKKAIDFWVVSSNKRETLQRIRAYRNQKDIFWQKPIHNHLNIAKADYTSDIVISFGYSASHRKDPDRTLRILTKYVKAHPECARERYYLAREYFYRGQLQKTIDELDQYLPRSYFKSERADAWLYRARCLWLLRRGEEARKSCCMAILNNPNFKEAFLFMSRMISEENRGQWLRMAEIADNSNVLFIRTGDFEWLPPMT